MGDIRQGVRIAKGVRGHARGEIDIHALIAAEIPFDVITHGIDEFSAINDVITGQTGELIIAVAARQLIGVSGGQNQFDAAQGVRIAKGIRRRTGAKIKCDAVGRAEPVFGEISHLVKSVSAVDDVIASQPLKTLERRSRPGQGVGLHCAAHILDADEAVGVAKSIRGHARGEIDIHAQIAAISRVMGVIDEIQAGSAIYGVISCVAFDLIIAAAAIDGVVSALAAQTVVFIAAGDAVAIQAAAHAFYVRQDIVIAPAVNGQIGAKVDGYGRSSAILRVPAVIDLVKGTQAAVENIRAIQALEAVEACPAYEGIRQRRAARGGNAGERVGVQWPCRY